MIKKKLFWILIIIGSVMLIFTSLILGCSSRHKYARQLIEAIEEDDFERFNQLVDKNRNLDVIPHGVLTDWVNLPPLHHACAVGKYEYVVKLVEAGADINYTKHPIHETPLMLALNHPWNEDRFKIARYLVENGADVNISVYGSTALDYVFSPLNRSNYSYSELKKQEEEEYEFALYLISKGADIENVGLGHLIFYAARGKNTLMIDYLINEKNVNINITDNSYGNTALIWAVWFSSDNVVKYLIENGADLQIKNKDGKTAKDIAIEENNPKILELFDIYT